MNNNEFNLRRKRLLAQIGENCIVLVSAAAEHVRNYENLYPYRQDSDFYYLTGFDEPDSVAVLIPGRPEGEFILFSRERSCDAMIWFGKNVGQEVALSEYGANQAFPISLFDSMLPDLLANKEKVYYKFGLSQAFDQKIITAVNANKTKAGAGINPPRIFIDLSDIVHEMRLKKSPSEITYLKNSIQISTHAFKRAMQNCHSGMYEYELEAELRYEFTRRGSKYEAFESIVGGGKNACILHYTKNNEKLVGGELVLIDAGVEVGYYSSDITRTFPINGRFSPEQQSVYEAVLDTQLAVIAMIKPGVKWGALQELAELKITENLVKLGILQGDVEELYAKKACKKFFMHRIGHWLGIDCHDQGKYRKDDDWRELEPGFVFTVEPGIYIIQNTEGVEQKWWNIGIRIEDDVLVTENGCEVLSKDLPKTIHGIESLMKGK
ncbi:MAG: aminopeptidase P N-terminal domain-containing protein [Gammaproteobacteria bacterium]|nr:aminopeptidase P N-terminal domain-containing protein [Gammaproteobacteria bacterium]